ncbi:MAG: DMT family transporter [Euryarchaeota archaeon]|jgi:drug/metabolite transporter (DMT)-like permease|nr:DMT family transporter [Euryarchaeota archaeon]MBT4391750.1 DMT family transporter [Euryarchaeota archaeon]MBT4802106.1 DMT family transporter [Euryarchaeota archaeon]MBT5613448.1 DMT family transporter [Euryarchaeota archaeon]MBT6683309.1 DMT family transporter [Euryarchaeota archaeon]
MSKRVLGRNLDSLSSLAEDGPNLSSFTEHSTSPIDSPKVAVFWMIFGSICFGSMNALVKWTASNADVWMIIFIRSVVIALIVAIIANLNNITLVPKDTKTMFLRCLSGLIAMILYFSALARIPIGQAVTLQYTAPLFVALLSGRIIREKVSPSIFILLILSFFGIILVISPTTEKIEPDAFLALGSGFFAALAYIFVRKLRQTDSPASVVFWFALFSILGSVIQAAPDLNSLTPKILLALVGVGIGAGGGQIGITMAYHKANAAWVSAFSYLTVIIATFYGYLIFDETLTITNIIGGIMIVCSGVALVFISPTVKK